MQCPPPKQQPSSLQPLEGARPPRLVAGGNGGGGLLGSASCVADPRVGAHGRLGENHGSSLQPPQRGLGSPGCHPQVLKIKGNGGGLAGIE